MGELMLLLQHSPKMFWFWGILRLAAVNFVQPENKV